MQVFQPAAAPSYLQANQGWPGYLMATGKCSLHLPQFRAILELSHGKCPPPYILGISKYMVGSGRGIFSIAWLLQGAGSLRLERTKRVYNLFCLFIHIYVLCIYVYEYYIYIHYIYVHTLYIAYTCIYYIIYISILYTYIHIYIHMYTVMSNTLHITYIIIHAIHYGHNGQVQHRLEEFQTWVVFTSKCSYSFRLV